MTELHELISIGEAFRRVDETLAGRLLSSERVAAADAYGRVLSADHASRLDLPPFDKSAVDGYAILRGDERDEYRLVETVRAGQVGKKPLMTGTTVKVMTGAPVPKGTGRMVMVEHAEEKDGVVRIQRRDSKANICWKAEDLRRGDTVLSEGTFCSALEVANLIAAGLSTVDVRLRPRVVVISTGDEIVEEPESLRPGKIMNTNGPMLEILARARGLDVVGRTAIADDRSATLAAIRAGIESADIVVISGGVSVGDFDFVLEALSEAGLKLHFARVAVKPGKPTTFASGGGKAVFGLPGNPVSVFLMFHLLVMRAAALITGGPVGLRKAHLPLAATFKRRKADRCEYVPGRLGESGSVEIVQYHGSAHLAGLIDADGFFLVPRGATEVQRGTPAPFFLMPKSLP